MAGLPAEQRISDAVVAGGDVSRYAYMYAAALATGKVPDVPTAATSTGEREMFAASVRHLERCVQRSYQFKMKDRPHIVRDVTDLGHVFDLNFLSMSARRDAEGNAVVSFSFDGELFDLVEFENEWELHRKEITEAPRAQASPEPLPIRFGLRFSGEDRLGVVKRVVDRIPLRCHATLELFAARVIPKEGGPAEFVLDAVVNARDEAHKHFVLTKMQRWAERVDVECRHVGADEVVRMAARGPEALLSSGAQQAEHTQKSEEVVAREDRGWSFFRWIRSRK